MPTNVVKTVADEKKWKAAKHAIKDYSGERDKRYWKRVMGLYMKMKGK